MHTDPDILNTNVPDDESIAAALGLDDLRIGRHYLRDESGARVGCIWLDTLWLLHVRPSFNHHGIVGVATSHGEEFREVESQGWIKAVLASGDSITVQHIESDPLPDQLAQLPLLTKSDSLFLDGVGYELRARTSQIQTNISFANPTLPQLVAVEQSCWNLADTIARKSHKKSLVPFTKTWQEYLDRRT